MQLIKHGPDIPDELLQAQEEGRVVFFCGAGISVPAGLPNFKDLVTRIYKRLNEPRTTSERRDSCNHQYEAVLEQLESRLADGRRVVRKTMFDILSLNKRKNQELNLETHKALLQLAGFAEGAGRMVTTNYDHCFTEAAKALNLVSVEGQSYQAPLLPIPRLDRWNGLFYLHGLMPEIYDDSAMQELVLTSADFGRAYLKDNWASHFIIELLRHYSVCFVGYSINDTVMRYLLDALAADTESRRQVWAFASYKPGKKLEAQSEWETKKVQPILFESSSKFSNYCLLHQSLQEWARKQSGGNWRKELIEQSVRLSPLESSPADDYVGRMIWALSDEKGKGAELLASLPELPSFDWVKALSESRFTTSDLIRKGFFSESQSLNERPQFSLLRRGYPCGKGRQMALVRYPGEVFHLDPRMGGLATWVARFWDDPHLVQWVEDHGGQLDEEFIDKIRDQLAHADAVVGPKRDHQHLEQAVYWLQKFNGTATLRDSFQMKFSDWVQDFQRWGLTGSLRIRLRELLRPWVRNRINPEFELSDREKKPGLWSDVEISVSDDDFEILKNSKLWSNSQYSLLLDYEILLTDVLRLFEELGNMGDQDWSVYSMPLVGDRLGNRRAVSWTLLIELLRDAWLQQVGVDTKEAIATAERWYAQPFMLFKRMAFFAASQNILPVTVWSQWLFDKNGAYLVSSFTRREVQQLLASRGKELNNQKQKALQTLIKSKCQEDVDLVGTAYARCERSTLLDSCRTGGMKLTRESNQFLVNVSKGIRINSGKKAEVEAIPEELSQLIDWVKRQEQREMTPRMWRQFNEFCSENIDLCHTALIMLHEEGEDSVQFWRIGLSAFTVEHIGWERWTRLLTILPQLPVTALLELRQSIAWWMLGAFEIIDQTVCQDNPELRKQVVLTITLLLSLGRVRTELISSGDEANGLLIRSLLRFWNKIGKPTVDQKIPVDIKVVLDLVCADKTEMWSSAHKNLAKDTVALYLIDPEWTRTKLLPLFHWQTNPKEAAEVWHGFLVGSRWHPTLMQEIKLSFFAIAGHLDQMSDSVTPYVSMLVSMGLTYPHCYSQVELKSLFSKFTKDMRLIAIRQIENGLSQMSQNDKIRNWYHVLMPFFKKIWPRNKGESDPEISQRYCSLLMKADDVFPEVFEIFRPLLAKAKYDYLVIKNLRETEYCNAYPRETLEFIDLVLGDQVTHRDWLQECLNTITSADVVLKKSSIYKKMKKLV